MDAILIRKPNLEFLFEAATDSDLEKLKKIGIGKPVKVTWSRPRNYEFHKKYFSLLNLVFENLDEPFKDKYTIFSIDSLLWQVKMQLGHFEEKMTLGGKILYEAKSISFAKMLQDEFEDFYLKTYNVLAKYFAPYLKNIDFEEIENYY